MKNLTKILLIIALSVPSFSGGSISFSEVNEILKRNPSLKRYLDKTYLFSQVGTASRFGREWVNIGGFRSSPYTFNAIDKNTKIKMELTINCDRGYLNKKKKIIKQKNNEYTTELYEIAFDFVDYPYSITVVPAEVNVKKIEAAEKKLAIKKEEELKKRKRNKEKIKGVNYMEK